MHTTAVLIIILLPGNIVPGSERQIEFPTMELCEKAIAGVDMSKEDRGSIVYCTAKPGEIPR